MERTVTIDCFPDSVRRYTRGYAVVAVDVLRATTTAITAVATGRRCFPVASVEEALPVAARLDKPLLVGELGGNTPYGFDITNSPAEIESRSDVWRPMILLSSAGTQVMCEAAACDAAYVASFRNVISVSDYLARCHRNVVIIGAGTRREFREEDQMCCAWIAERLLRTGFTPTSQDTCDIINAWKDKPPEACMTSKSVTYLRDTGQLRDLEFVLSHINDIDDLVVLHQKEVIRIAHEARPLRSSSALTVPMEGGAR